ncbi:hypothetical protein QMK19_03745 [Streptomyces sp. H10-C2]|uniref:hypothetical protein n=1 Tax=unclassified Streptomyces TaxID=2593676 RepID=UPI0024B93D25|nr:MULTISPECIES: hypothetical protein [unclassified Streptomyces]MDJ0345239.1 hypothetical protein [Streptomyces sp. PH10-H1]MDJ0368815.1 hypothetical protein [Streptomyces sp. H10-C2]
MSVPQWKKLLDHVVGVPERIYEHWNSVDGWDNDTAFGREFGENGVSWCVIFDWDMYHDVGLDAIVPKVDNVGVFSDWAKSHGQWSEYPSVGAWVNLNDGGHTETVIGFDADTVYTKGGNSIQTGSSDNGQGNGVWSHETPRRAAKVVGYLAPHFPDGVCPPTADPKDPRGGKAVASYRWAPEPSPTPGAPAFPGRDKFVLGASNAFALELQTWLARGDWGPRYRVGPSRTMAQIDLQKVAALQQHYLSALGPADGLCGPLTWRYAYETAYGLRSK